MRRAPATPATSSPLRRSLTAHPLSEFSWPPRGPRRTHAYCTVCHSERIVAQQGLTRFDWEELLEQMVEEHGMNPIGEPDLGRVLDYLAANYGPDRPNFPGH